MSTEHCPVCDRADCPRFINAEPLGDWFTPSEVQENPDGARRAKELNDRYAAKKADCQAHAVDWRHEALALRARLAALDAWATELLTLTRLILAGWMNATPNCALDDSDGSPLAAFRALADRKPPAG